MEPAYDALSDVETVGRAEDYPSPPSELDKLRELMGSLENARDPELLRTLVNAQVVVAMDEQVRALVAEHNAFLDRLDGAFVAGAEKVASVFAELPS